VSVRNSWSDRWGREGGEGKRLTFRRRRNTRAPSSTATRCLWASSSSGRDGASGSRTLRRAGRGGPAEAQLGLLLAVGAVAHFGGGAGGGGSFAVAGGVGAGAFVLVLLGGELGCGGCADSGGGVGVFGGLVGEFDDGGFAVGGGGGFGPGRGGLFRCGGGWWWCGGAGAGGRWDRGGCAGWLGGGGGAVFLFVLLARGLGAACFGEIGRAGAFEGVGG